MLQLSEMSRKLSIQSGSTVQYCNLDITVQVSAANIWFSFTFYLDNKKVHIAIPNLTITQVSERLIGFSNL